MGTRSAPPCLGSRAFASGAAQASVDWRGAGEVQVRCGMCLLLTHRKEAEGAEIGGAGFGW
ncbi:MAG: hypothetical protein MIO93_10620 [ANME-2 cluster archaeon]|nr:hypothetical protein [ANME-2 cluster archaeon]